MLRCVREALPSALAAGIGIGSFRIIRRAHRTKQWVAGPAKLGCWYAKGRTAMGLILLIVILVLVFGGGGGYYGYNRWGYAGGGGLGLGTIVLILLVCWLLGVFH
jgi:hypothetical protein